MPVRDYAAEKGNPFWISFDDKSMNYGFFAPLPVRPLACSPFGSFAPCLFRPLACSPPVPGLFALWLVRLLALSSLYLGRFAPIEYR